MKFFQEIKRIKYVLLRKFSQKSICIYINKAMDFAYSFLPNIRTDFFKDFKTHLKILMIIIDKTWVFLDTKKMQIIINIIENGKYLKKMETSKY